MVSITWIRVYLCIVYWTQLLATLQSTWSEWTMRTTFELPVGTCCGLLTSA